MGFVVFMLIAGVAVCGLYSALLAYSAVRPARHTAGYAVARGLACDPGDMGLAFESWWLDRPGGVRLPVWEIAGECANGPVVVLIHGWGQSRVDSLVRAETWRVHASRVVMYDLRGHGEAEPEGMVARLGADDHEDLSELMERLGCERVMLVGHSMGGVIALHAAACDSVAGRVVGVVAYGPYCKFHSSLQGRLRTHGLPARPFTDVAMAWFRLKGMRFRDIIADVKAVPCPVLVIHGDQDTISPPDDGAVIVEAARDGTLVMIEGAGHRDGHTHDEALHQEALGAFWNSLGD